jgi:pimeloyl-ACP methyl ester carboxylesterase
MLLVYYFYFASTKKVFYCDLSSIPLSLPIHFQKLSLPKTPTLFLFGGKKRVMFHSSSYLDALEKDPASAYKEYQDCGHWLHWTNADEVYSDILTFLNQKS